MTPQKDQPPVNPAEWTVCSAVAPLLGSAGVANPDVHAPQVLGYLHRFGFAVSFRGDPVEGHGGPRTCKEGTRDAAALRHRLNPVGLHLARIEPEWPSCRPAPPQLPVREESNERSRP